MKYLKNEQKQIPHFVFYDDKCPLCSKEIKHYRSLKQCYPIKWIAIHDNDEIISQFDFNKQELLQRLHVVRGDGVTVSGASAFATIWSSLERYRVIGILIYKLRFVSTLDLAYRIFARWRYRRLVCEV